MENNVKIEKNIKKKLKKNQKLSLMGFVTVTASAIVAFYTFPSLSTAGWIAIIFAFITALCWFLPLAMAAAEMATVRGWTHGGIFTWVRNILGPRWGFLVNWLQFQVTIGFVAMVFFVLTSFGFSFGGVEGYNFFNSLKLGTTINQSSYVNYSSNFNPVYIFLIGMALLILIMGLSLLGQHRTHQAGQFGFIVGILLPFLIVSAFSIYTVATMKDPLSIIGKTFQKEHHFDPVFMGSSFVLNKQFATSTVMASFMAFMFSLHGVEVSAVAANRMKNPSKMYPKAMGVVVALALGCAILGSITISMTVPSSTLSFTGGLVQSMLFSMSVGGVTVDGQNFSSLADAFSQIEHKYSSVQAEAIFNQYIYGDQFKDLLINPLNGASVSNLKVTPIDKHFLNGIRAMSFFIGIGVFIEIAVWTSNLSNGLCYATEKLHFHKWASSRLKNGSPLGVTVFNIVIIVLIFCIFTFSYQNLDSYKGQTITDILSPVLNNGTENLAGMSTDKINQMRDQLKPLYDAKLHFIETTPFSEVEKVMNNIKQIAGVDPVASGTPASQTNISFISNVIMQISTYFVGYTIFLIGYIKFALVSNKIHHEFKIKWLWLQILFASLALATTIFAAIATYLPAAPELYPGKEVYYKFLAVSISTYLSIVLLGIVIYEVNKIRLKKMKFDHSETPKLVEGTLEQHDLQTNKEFYLETSTKNEENTIMYNRMLEIDNELSNLYNESYKFKSNAKSDIEEQKKYDDILIIIEELEQELYNIQTKYYKLNQPMLFKWIEKIDKKLLKDK